MTVPEPPKMSTPPTTHGGDDGELEADAGVGVDAAEAGHEQHPGRHRRSAPLIT